MRRAQLMGAVLLVVLLLVACTPKVAPVPTPEPDKPALSSPAAATSTAKPSWQEEWDKTAALAKKEGSLVVLTSAGPAARRGVGEAFKSGFGVSIEWLAGSAAELTVKIMNERRAGIYSVDATIIGYAQPPQTLKPAGAVEPLEPVLFLPELTDPQEIQKVWRFGLEWVDKDHTTLNFSTAVNYSLVVNTQLVKPGEIKSFRDLLDPKWKGKMVMLDPGLGAGPGTDLSVALGLRLMDWDYVRQLAQEVMLTRDARLQMTWVAQGKYPIGIALRPETIKEFVSIGAPVQVLTMDEGGYTTPGAGSIVFIKKAPHPSAAKLFINWLLSKEGQTVYSKAQGVPGNRLDISVDGLDPLIIPDPKKKYVSVGTEEWLQVRTEGIEKAKAIFAPR